MSEIPDYDTIPDFDAAVAQFQKFLLHEDAGREIVWFFREDIASRRRNIWIRWPLPAENLQCARELYERGRQIGIGVELAAECRVGKQVCCWVNVAENKEESVQQMLEGLKLFLSTERPGHSVLAEAHPVQAGWRWLLVSLCLRTRIWEEIPSRRAECSSSR